MPTVHAVERGVVLDAVEATGAIRDSVTILPIVVALGLLTPASLPHVLARFAIACLLGITAIDIVVAALTVAAVVVGVVLSPAPSGCTSVRVASRLYARTG